MGKYSIYIKWLSTLAFMLMLMISCSTEKNTLINRTYHSTTAKYNGYFNAKELLRVTMENYKRNSSEDYFQLLPITLTPNEDEIVDMYPMIDTAISKCQTVISKHSMPTASKPSKKKAEYARWIDMNWLLIGQAQYLRKDYQKAYETFEYVKKFYSGQSSSYAGQLWQAKTQIKLKMYPEAQRNLRILDDKYQTFLNELSGKPYFLYKRKFRKVSKKDPKNDMAAPFSNDLRYELNIAKAELALAQKNEAAAIPHLEAALKLAKKKYDKARLNFILGQLYQKQGDETARKFYSATLKKAPPFEMEFNARINRAVSGGKDTDEIIEELDKMQKEQRYLEYRDQILYAMALVELDRNEKKQAKKYLSKSVFYSLNNNRQKGVSYEKLGDLSFKERNYVAAQKYYDSSSQVIPETYFNYDVILSKAKNLEKLVIAENTINHEDSVQRIAKMDESEREKYLEDVIEQLKEQERLRKEREALRAEQLKDLQRKQAAQSAGEGNKFYFSNLKSMNEGFEEFRRYWGQRENEDNWRRSNKTPMFADFEEDTLQAGLEIGDLEQEINYDENTDPRDVPVEDLTTEILTYGLPLTDSALHKSNVALLTALYNAGMIYKEQLEEPELGADKFKRVVEHNVENEHNVMSAFQLYNLYKESKASEAKTYSDYILKNYPSSDYANFLKDPDYFVKKKEIEALALKDYLRSVERYQRGLFYPVILKATTVIENEPENKFRPQYFLLKAMSMGRMSDDKDPLIPILEQAIEEYPDTEIAEKAQQMKDDIINGIAPFEAIDFSIGGDLYEYSTKGKFYVLIYLEGGADVRSAQTKVADFNREFFSRDRLKTNTQIVDAKLTFVRVSEFASEADANNYIRDYKRTKKYLGELRNNKILFISHENYKVLIKERKVKDYEEFFENYH